MKKLPTEATSLCRFSNSRVFYVFASAPLRAFLSLCKGDLRLCKGTACLTTAAFYVFARASVGTLGPPLCKDVNIFGGNCSITLSTMAMSTAYLYLPRLGGGIRCCDGAIHCLPTTATTLSAIVLGGLPSLCKIISQSYIKMRLSGAEIIYAPPPSSILLPSFRRQSTNSR